MLAIKNIVINRTSSRPIPLSVCPCSRFNNQSYCFSSTLGETIPGQTLTIELKVSEQWLKQQSLSKTTLVIDNPSDDDVCEVPIVSQLSQTYFNKCNKYYYTLWPHNGTNSKTCRLFLGLINMPEMFYVKLKGCPPGFKL